MAVLGEPRAWTIGDNLDQGPALAVLGGPLVEPELADDGHLPALGQPVGAGAGQLVEGDDVDEVGAISAAGGGEAEGAAAPRTR